MFCHDELQDQCVDEAIDRLEVRADVSEGVDRYFEPDVLEMLTEELYHCDVVVLNVLVTFAIELLELVEVVFAYVGVLVVVDVEVLLGPRPAKISVSLNPVIVVLLRIGVNTVDNILRKGAPAASTPEAYT